VLLPETRLQHDAARINGIADAIFALAEVEPAALSKFERNNSRAENKD
jgi:hypothetical protein